MAEGRAVSGAAAAAAAAAALPPWALPPAAAAARALAEWAECGSGEAEARGEANSHTVSVPAAPPVATRACGAGCWIS